MNVDGTAPDLMVVAEAALQGAVKGLKQGGELIAGEARRIIYDERRNTGQLDQAIFTETLPPEGEQLVQIVGVTGGAATYAPFVEYDTAPHRPPIAALIRWASTKVGRIGGGDPRELAGRAFGSIAKHGTTGIHFMQRSYEAKVVPAQEAIAAAIKEAIAPYAS